jgi:SnoaL-like domain
VERTLEGPSEVLGFFQALVATQQNQKLTTERWVAQGDTVATLGRYSCTVTGKHFDSPVAHFFTIRDGKISRLVISATPPPSPKPTPPPQQPQPEQCGAGWHPWMASCGRLAIGLVVLNAWSPAVQ